MKDDTIAGPFMFNPLKHHLGWIRDFIALKLAKKDAALLKEIRQIGNSVMDVYTGNLKVPEILGELNEFLDSHKLLSRKVFSDWTGTGYSDFRMATLTDGSQWIMKYHEDEHRYVHLFPARTSPHTFRIKANTLKSAILYLILSGKDYVNEEDLNMARAMAGLSPVKEVAETEAVSEAIEILRNLD